MAIIFCLDLIRSNHFFRKRYSLIGIVLFIGIILLSSRTSLLLSIIILLIKLLSNSSKLKIRKTIYFFISFFVLGLVLTFSIPTLKKRVLNFNENVSSYSGVSLRAKIWKNVIKFLKNPQFTAMDFINLKKN